MSYEVFEKVMNVVLGLTLALTVILILCMIWYMIQPHETYRLDSREWECTQYEERVSYIMVGKVMTPIHVDQCVNYHRQ